MRDALLVVHGVPDDATTFADFESGVIDALGSERARSASVFLLDLRASGDAAMALRDIRGHRSPQIYLKPVVLLADGAERGGVLERAVDGVWDVLKDPEPPPGLASRMERLRQRADAMAVSGPEGDAQLPFRILRFMATREAVYEPEPTIESPTGYRYPPLAPFLGGGDDGQDVGELLASLESDHRVLEGQFAAKAYACTHCGCGFLNFVEICPNCGSAHLTEDETVHHYRCGYVAPFREFRRGNALYCPKCEKELQHIGVDYDKPSPIYDCNECGHRFPEPEVTTACYRCRRVTPPESQVQRTIKSYAVSPFGLNAARYGLDSLLVSVLQTRMQLFEYGVFKQFLAAEASRVERYPPSKSTLVVMFFDEIDQIYLELGSRSRELFEEIAVELSSIVRESDLLSSRNESLFLALFAQTSIEQVRPAVDRLRATVDNLLRVALKSPPSFTVTIHPVGGELDLDAVVADVVGKGGSAKESRS